MVTVMSVRENISSMIDRITADTIEGETSACPTESHQPRKAIMESNMVARSMVQQICGEDKSDTITERCDPWTHDVTLQDIWKKLELLEALVRRTAAAPRQVKSTVAAAPAMESTAMDAYAAADDAQIIEGRLEKWVSEKGFGFVKVATSSAFIHMSCIAGDVEKMWGCKLAVKLERDRIRGNDKLRVTKAERWEAYEASQAREAATRLATQTLESAAAAKKASEVAEDASIRACWNETRIHKPPGLEEIRAVER